MKQVTFPLGRRWPDVVPQVGDVVQIDPRVSVVYGGCLALVLAVRWNGEVEACVPAPGREGARDAVMQLPRAAYGWVGMAAWVPPEINDTSSEWPKRAKRAVREEEA